MIKLPFGDSLDTPEDAVTILSVFTSTKIDCKREIRLRGSTPRIKYTFHCSSLIYRKRALLGKIKRRFTMKLWSRGLGKTEIHLDFRYYQTMREPESGNMLIIGTMQDPVNWEFKITLQPEDIGGIINLVLKPSMFHFIMKNLHHYARYLFNRKKFRRDDNLVEAVNSAYEQVMFGRRPIRERVTQTDRGV